MDIYNTKSVEKLGKKRRSEKDKGERERTRVRKRSFFDCSLIVSES